MARRRRLPGLRRRWGSEILALRRPRGFLHLLLQLSTSSSSSVSAILRKWFRIILDSRLCGCLSLDHLRRKSICDGILEGKKQNRTKPRARKNRIGGFLCCFQHREEGMEAQRWGFRFSSRLFGWEENPKREKERVNLEDGISQTETKTTPAMDGWRDSSSFL